MSFWGGIDKRGDVVTHPTLTCTPTGSLSRPEVNLVDPMAQEGRTCGGKRWRWAPPHPIAAHTVRGESGELGERCCSPPAPQDRAVNPFGPCGRNG